jgi:diguanylate cyclase (GGDEF)-like protein
MLRNVVTSRGRLSYAFTDPLGASDPAGTRRRISRGHVLIYGAATPSLLVAMLADGGPLSQRLAAGGAMLVTALTAMLLLVWRKPPDVLLVGAFPLAALVVTAIAVLDPPLSLTPMFYVFPLMTAAYFLGRRAVHLTYAVVVGSFGAVALWVLEDEARFIMWVTVAVVGGVVVVFVQTLKNGLNELVGRLGALAREDPLTGALNRRALLERLDAAIAGARRTGGSCAVAVVDIDHFKEINDRYGHAAGDAALRRVVATVSKRLRRDDELGRMGGEEFAILLSGAGAEGAAAYADELRMLVAGDAQAAGTPFTVSVGVAALPQEPVTAEDLLAAADEALYRAKRAGRDTVRAA